MQSYDGFSHRGNKLEFFIDYSCDKRMKMRHMGKKALKSVAKEVFGIKISVISVTSFSLFIIMPHDKTCPGHLEKASAQVGIYSAVIHAMCRKSVNVR